MLPSPSRHHTYRPGSSRVIATQEETKLAKQRSNRKHKRKNSHPKDPQIPHSQIEVPEGVDEEGLWMPYDQVLKEHLTQQDLLYFAEERRLFRHNAITSKNAFQLQIKTLVLNYDRQDNLVCWQATSQSLQIATKIFGSRVDNVCEEARQLMVLCSNGHRNIPNEEETPNKENRKKKKPQEFDIERIVKCHLGTEKQLTLKQQDMNKPLKTEGFNKLNFHIQHKLNEVEIVMDDVMIDSNFGVSFGRREQPTIDQKDQLQLPHHILAILYPNQQEEDDDQFDTYTQLIDYVITVGVRNPNGSAETMEIIKYAERVDHDIRRSFKAMKTAQKALDNGFVSNSGYSGNFSSQQEDSSDECDSQSQSPAVGRDSERQNSNFKQDLGRIEESQGANETDELKDSDDDSDVNSRDSEALCGWDSVGNIAGETSSPIHKYGVKKDSDGNIIYIDSQDSLSLSISETDIGNGVELLSVGENLELEYSSLLGSAPLSMKKNLPLESPQLSKVRKRLNVPSKMRLKDNENKLKKREKRNGQGEELDFEIEEILAKAPSRQSSSQYITLKSMLEKHLPPQSDTTCEFRDEDFVSEFNKKMFRRVEGLRINLANSYKSTVDSQFREGCLGKTPYDILDNNVERRKKEYFDFDGFGELEKEDQLSSLEEEEEKLETNQQRGNLHQLKQLHESKDYSNLSINQSSFQHLQGANSLYPIAQEKTPISSNIASSTNPSPSVFRGRDSSNRASNPCFNGDSTQQHPNPAASQPEDPSDDMFELMNQLQMMSPVEHMNTQQSSGTFPAVNNTTNPLCYEFPSLLGQSTYEFEFDSESDSGSNSQDVDNPHSLHPTGNEQGQEVERKRRQEELETNIFYKMLARGFSYRLRDDLLANDQKVSKFITIKDLLVLVTQQIEVNKVRHLNELYDALSEYTIQHVFVALFHYLNRCNGRFLVKTDGKSQVLHERDIQDYSARGSGGHAIKAIEEEESNHKSSNRRQSNLNSENSSQKQKPRTSQYTLRSRKLL